jgi:uncharacterized membrane protein YiaA
MRADWTDLALLVGVLLIGYWVAADYGLAALGAFVGALLVVVASAVAYQRGRGD